MVPFVCSCQLTYCRCLLASRIPNVTSLKQRGLGRLAFVAQLRVASWFRSGGQQESTSTRCCGCGRAPHAQQGASHALNQWNTEQAQPAWARSSPSKGRETDPASLRKESCQSAAARLWSSPRPYGLFPVHE